MSETSLNDLPAEFGEAVVPSLWGIERALHLLDRIRASGREDILGRRLAPGMFDCETQLRMVGILALRATYVLVGQEWPRDIEDGEFPAGAEGLEARLRLAAAQVKDLAPETFAGAFERSVTHQAGDAMVSQPGDVYLRLFIQPNLWFHLSMAYAIARGVGLGIGKGDYDGWHSYEPGFSFVDGGVASPVQEVPDWVVPPRPAREPIRGRYVTLEPLTVDHAAELWQAQSDPEIWRYISVGPFQSEAQFTAWVTDVATADDPLQFAVRMADGRLGGTMSLMRITPAAGTIEVGYIVFTPRLQRTREASEAVYLMMKWAFEAGYRRFEWKCDAANMPSRRAAERFGLSYEGVFRQAAVVKGRNRDTAWFATIDEEWPALREAFETWLAPENFDADGQQVRRLSDLTAPVLVARDPAV